ncbi:hypothetical protein SEA_NAPOLEONB_16 [Arthrobacter phage NapoleonB]|uniref:Uncharacterized protein n=1 Tax=Arthrobacter phage Dynamite TaxID=2867479 RepID=A0AAE8XKG9_9CAUD|nr:hypothetical protein PQB82_gp16 [Arthrobacter phage Dynamite]QFP94984.1 hypothetical protein SEA_NAPOLEONB_16 [Arthrobacter phage NapoleonB]UAW09177.1 hypothetical protein SEA_DYNAMITE_16 [Arthrobacter phage Dynamite]
MLTIKLPAIEGYDEASSRFVNTEPELILELEHSLVSLSKWEEIWEVPFLSKDEKTSEQVLSYVECMMLSPNIPPGIFERFNDEHFKQINEYIEAKRTATWFGDTPGSKPSTTNQAKITAEVIYSWMITHRIPPEYAHWHLRKLITLIEVMNRQNAPQKSNMSKSEMLAERARLNAERRKQFNSAG